MRYYVYVTCYASHDAIIEKYVWSVQVMAPVKMLQVLAVTLNTSKDTGVRERVLEPRATLVLVLQRMEIMNV